MSKPVFAPIKYAFITLTLASCGAATPEAKQNIEKPAKLLRLTEPTTRETNSLPAVIRSVRTTELAFQVGGQIVQWNAVDGSEFRRGQIIAKLDARSFRAALMQAQAQYNNANSEYQRARRLIEEDAISRSVVENRQAQRQIAKAALDTARKNLSDTILRAPFDGFVGRTLVEQFQNVGPQQTVLSLQSEAVEAIVNVPASFVLNFNQVRISNIFVELDAAPGRKFPAKFREATGQADNTTQTFQARFTFSPPADLLVLNGMAATLSFEAEDIETDNTNPGVEVPLTSVMADGKTRFVWIVEGRQRILKRRNITLAQSIGKNVKVTKGLRAGDQIVATGGKYLNAGDKVRPWKK